MTVKADFSDEEWDLLLQAPPNAGMVVITADRGGSIRETFSMAKFYAEAKEESGDSELVNEIVSAKPEADSGRYDSEEEFKDACLKSLREAVDLLDKKATREELEDYKKFVLILADRAANARKEGFMGLRGERVSDAEREAIGEIAAALA
jgi:predicted house-cleaning noncanonical NTP pyrophosphatase (MazG superfamily)